jgi:hypothetical protein
VRPSPPEALVQAYLIHIGDRSDTNFRKILDLKGLRKQEQNSLADLFNAHCMAPNNMNLPASSPFLTPLQVNNAASGATNASVKDMSAATPGLSGGRFDAATFGSALMNVAREGVDRLGTPNLGVGVTGGLGVVGGHPGPDAFAGGGNNSFSGAAAGSSAATPAASTGSPVQEGGATANLNENLKNIGNFFRRDGGFARFGRGGGRGGGGPASGGAESGGSATR